MVATSTLHVVVTAWMIISKENIFKNCDALRWTWLVYMSWILEYKRRENLKCYLYRYTCKQNYSKVECLQNNKLMGTGREEHSSPPWNLKWWSLMLFFFKAKYPKKFRSYKYPLLWFKPRKFAKLPHSDFGAHNMTLGADTHAAGKCSCTENISHAHPFGNVFEHPSRTIVCTPSENHPAGAHE